MCQTVASERSKVRKDSFPNEKIMSVQCEASNLLREIVSPREPGESVKALWLRASRKTGISFSRITKLWYGLPARIDAYEMDTLRRAAAARKGNGKEKANGTEVVDREYLKILEARMDELHRKIDELLSRDPLANTDVAASNSSNGRKATA